MISLMYYDPNWPLFFEQERSILQEVLGAWIISIEHIGSTSVPKMLAKPIIDIVIVVDSLEIADKFIIEAMTHLGYEYKKDHESTMPDRRYFKKKGPDNAYNVHLVQSGNNFYYESMLFRDILRKDSKVFEAYQKLKTELAKSYNDENEYAIAKTEFISAVLKAGEKK